MLIARVYHMSAFQVHFRVQCRGTSWFHRSMPVAFVLQLLLRVATASKLLFLSRSRSLFAARRVAGQGGVVEVATEGRSLHVRTRVMQKADESGLILCLLSRVGTAHWLQIRGWGSASLVLCARVLSESTSLRTSSFTGLELEAPTAMCCSSDCKSAIGAVKDLATTAMRGMDPNAVVTCSDGHATRLHHFVGLIPDTKNGHAAELQYWLAVAESRASDSNHSAATLPPHIRASLAASLVRWSACLWQGNIADPVVAHCPRVWVGVRHARDDTLLLRPVCEHTECLHAVRPFQHRGVGTWSGVQASLSSMQVDGITHHETDAHIQVPVQDLMQRSGRVLALVSSGDSRDDEAQTLDPEDVLDGVTAVVTCVPAHAKVSNSIVASVHAGLRHPLQWVQVTAHGWAIR